MCLLLGLSHFSVLMHLVPWMAVDCISRLVQTTTGSLVLGMMLSSNVACSDSIEISATQPSKRIFFDQAI